MKPAKVNIIIYQGSTFQKFFTWKTGDPALPVDLTGYIIRSQFRSKLTSEEALIEFTTLNGKILIVDAPGGHFVLTLSASETTAIEFKSAVYDIEVESPSGYVTRLIEGTVTVSPEITR
jgi:hypothetical protein